MRAEELRRSTLVLAVLAVFTGTAVFWWAQNPRTDARDGSSSWSPQIASSDVDLAALEEMAKVSCECSMKGGEERACSAQFDAEVKRIKSLIIGDQKAVEEAAGYATACYPISTGSTCFGFSDGERCVVTDYTVVGALDDSGRQQIVCTLPQAQAIEHAYNEAWIVNGERVSSDDETAWKAANARADEAVATTLRRIRRGEEFRTIENHEGCAG